MESRGDCDVIKEDTLATPREEEGFEIPLLRWESVY